MPSNFRTELGNQSLHFSFNKKSLNTEFRLSFFIYRNQSLERKIIARRSACWSWFFNSSASDTVKVSSRLISRFVCSCVQVNSDQISIIYISQKIDLVSKKIYSDRPFKLSISIFLQNDSLFFNSFSDSLSRSDKFYKSCVLHNSSSNE